MWHLNKIPKIVHLYWGGYTLSWLQYMTVYSFQKLNPDWEIKIYAPFITSVNKTWNTFEHKVIIVSDNYIERLKNITNIKLIDFEEYGMSNDMFENYKADFLRWVLLSTIGGLWSDFDVLYFKNMNSLYFNKKENANIETVVCDQIYGHSVGFMMGSKNNVEYKKVLDLAKVSFNCKDYQSLGPNVINRLKITAFNMDMSVVYPYNANEIDKIYQHKEKGKITDKTIGLHWYAGYPESGKYMNLLNENNYKIFDTVVSELLNEVLND